MIRIRPRAPRLLAAASVVVVGCVLIVSPAHADQTPVPTPAVEVPAPVGPSSTDSSNIDPSAPAPSTPIPTVPVPTPTPVPSTASTPAPVPDADEQADVQQKKEQEQRHSDALPPSPGLTDEYLKRWEAMQILQSRLSRLDRRETEMRLAVHQANDELTAAKAAFNEASGALDAAQEVLNLTVRTMYINNTAQADSLMRALGQSPEDVMQSLNTAMYLNVIGNDKAALYEAAFTRYTAARAALTQATEKVEGLEKEQKALEDKIQATSEQYAAARKAFFALVTATKPQTDVDARGCPQAAPMNSSPVDVQVLCRRAVKQAATPQAASALKWALTRLGAPYACGGIGRMDPFRFDCSSYVSRAYADGAGLQTAGDTWAPSTRNMVPWDGVALDRHYAPISDKQLRPGDLVLYDTCPSNTCGYKHVAMYLGFDLMAHTNACGGVAHIEKFWGTGSEHNYLGARRVVALKGERVKVIAPAKHGKR